MSVLVDYVREMTLKKSCKYGEYGSFEHLLLLFGVGLAGRTMPLLLCHVPGLTGTQTISAWETRTRNRNLRSKGDIKINSFVTSEVSFKKMRCCTVGRFSFKTTLSFSKGGAFKILSSVSRRDSTDYFFN